MATKARQIYTADEQTLHKDKRTLEIESGYKTKIDGIEAGAEVNTIETIKVNGSEVEPDANRAVDLTIPNVIDNVSSVSSTDALSANMGRALAEEIQNLKAQGRFLSFWNAAAGRPTSEPPQELYTYHTGDYFIVNQVAVSGGTNYRPDGTTYTRGQVSTTVETEAVVVGSEYVFDGTIWLMLAGGGGGGGSIIVDENLSTTSHNPVWNATITNALNTKEVLSNKVTSLANPSNTTYPTTQAVATELATKQDTLTAGANIQINGNTISATDTTYTAGSGIAINNGVISNTRTSLDWGNITGTLSNQTDLNTALSGKQPVGDYATNTALTQGLATKQNTLTAGANISISGDTISATDTTYTAGTGINISGNVISSTVSSDIVDVKVDGTSVVTNKVANIDLSRKQDTLTAGTGINITNNTVSKKIFYVEVYASQIGLPNTTYADTVQAYQQGYELIRRYNGTSSCSIYELTYIRDSGAPSNPYRFYFSSDIPGEWYELTSSGWSTVSAGGGDMKYEDFEFVSKSGASVVLDLSSTITPTSNFTVNVPTEIKEGQIYVLRVTNGATSYTMTLGEGITNPRGTSLSLTANATDQFVFYAISNSVLELQAEGGGSGGPENIFVTQSEYDALTTIDPTKTYFIYEVEN